MPWPSIRRLAWRGSYLVATVDQVDSDLNSIAILGVVGEHPQPGGPGWQRPTRI